MTELSPSRECAVQESNLQPTITKGDYNPSNQVTLLEHAGVIFSADPRKASEHQNGSDNETTIRVSAHPVTSDRSRQ